MLEASPKAGVIPQGNQGFELVLCGITPYAGPTMYNILPSVPFCSATAHITVAQALIFFRALGGPKSD